MKKLPGGPWALIDRNNNIISDFANLYFNSPKEDRFVVYKSGEGYGIVRLHNDGELYQPALAEAIDTAQATDISINDIAEKAYTVKWKNIY